MLDYFYALGDSEQIWGFDCQKPDGSIFSLVDHAARVRVFSVAKEEWREFQAGVASPPNKGRMTFQPWQAERVGLMDEQGVYYLVWIAVRLSDSARLTFPDDPSRMVIWATTNK